MRTGSDMVRETLEEYGVSFRNASTLNSTVIKTREGNWVELYESASGKFLAYNLTPEQAAKIGLMLA